MNDPVNSPKHYDFAISPLDAIEAWGLNFHLGNAVKYIARAAHKGRELEDLKKARFYLNRAISNLEQATERVDEVLRRAEEVRQSLTDEDWAVIEQARMSRDGERP